MTVMRKTTTTTTAAATTTATTETALGTEAATVEPPPGVSGRPEAAGRVAAFDGGRVGRRDWRFGSIRWRILAGFVGLLAVTTLGSVLVAREVLLNRLDERIDAHLRQEVGELRKLADGVDPETGKPFAGASQLFDVFLARNVAAPNEALLTFVGGKPYLRSGYVVPYRLDTDPELVARWGSLRRSDRGSVDTPEGRVDFLAVPVRGAGHGVFVVAVFHDRELSAFDAAVGAAGGVGLAVLLIGSLLGWRVAESVLRPVRTVTQTARSISESDLGRRIDVQGDDEVAELASTFNGMLDRLETAFATQRRFLDDAGHELRTPITIVRGHLELLEESPEERRETLALVIDELDRMSRLVNDLLLLAKADADPASFLHLETVDVAALTEEVFAKTSAIAPRRWVLAATGRGRVVADRQRLTQAVVELAQNAASHTQRDDEIAFGSAVAAGEARFWVRDRGTGIPLEEQNEVFARFSRGRRWSSGDGAGLGLSIVQAIAVAHGGRVELRSRPGAGATFTLVIPVDQPADRPT
jgi:two-component system OmpR family sensor kinase